MNKLLSKRSFVNNFEVYVATAIFIAITVLMTIQVITRYVFGRAFAWAEEISIVGFVWMQYLGICASVLGRKQLRVDFLVNRMPHNLKKTVLIIGNVLTMLFCGVIIPPMLRLIENMTRNISATPLLRIPNWIVYLILPFSMALMIVRLVQESIILSQEGKEALNVTKPLIDLDAIENEHINTLKGEEAAKSI